jgi:hypothetical protein
MDINRVIDIIRTLKEDAPTMSMGAGGIAGSVEASNYDPNFTPPVGKRKKKNKYIYQKGMRKWWMGGNR